MVRLLQLKSRHVASILCAGVVLCSLCSCATDEADGEAIPLLEPVGSIEDPPLSASPGLALLASGIACVADSYQRKVVCASRQFARWELGSEGRGPGEFSDISKLIRVAHDDSAVAVVDWGNRRISIIGLEDGYRKSFEIPPLFTPIEPVGGGEVRGIYLGYDPGPMRGRLATVRESDGAILREIQLTGPVESDVEHPVRFLRGVALPDRAVFSYDSGHSFAVFTAAGNHVRGVSLPAHLRHPIWPTDRDVEDYVSDIRRFSGRDPTPTQQRAFRRRPLPPLLKETDLRVDSSGQVWAASARVHTSNSVLLILNRSGYLRSVAVRDRVLAFDLVGDTLVTLVVPFAGDEQRRRIDFYALQ